MAARRLRRFALVSLGIVFVLGAALTVWTYVEKAAFEERLERIRRAGDPLYTTDLARPPVPDEQNAAKLLEKAAAWLDRRRKQEDNHEGMLWEREPNRGEWTEEDWAQLHAYLDSCRPYFELVEQIPRRPKWHLDLRWGDGPGMAVHAIPWTQDVVEYTCARVEFDPVTEGRTERAARAAVFLLDYSERCRLPFLIGYLVTDVVGTQTARILRLAARKPGFDAALFRRLVDARLERAIAPTGPPAHVAKEERTLALWYIRAWLAGESIEEGDAYYRSFLTGALLYRDASRLLDVLEQAVAASETTAEAAASVAARLANGQEHDPLGLTSRIRLALRKLFDRYVESTAVQRLTRVVMALLEYRQAHTEWPQDLAALGALPIDPYSGIPFLYTRTDKGARVRAAHADYDTTRNWELLEDDNLAWSWEE